MEMERGKCVIASATSILKSENEDESKGTISAIVRKSLQNPLTLMYMLTRASVGVHRRL